MFANQYIFDGAHVGKQADVLEGAGNAQCGDLKRLKFGNIVTVEGEFTTGDRIDAGHRVKESCFACSVWTDQTSNHSFFDDEINIVNGNETAKGFSYFTGFEEVHSYLPLLGIATFDGRGSCSGRSWFIFFSMQFFTNLLTGD